MASTARAWQHPRWQYDERNSEAARRSALRAATRGATQSGGMATETLPSLRAKTSIARSVPTLRMAPPPSRLPRFQWRSLRAAALIVLAGAMLMAPVRLNMAVREAEYRFAQLENRQDALKAERAALQTKVAALTAHQRVDVAAQKMGMVPAAHFEFLDVGAGDGTEGVAAPADTGSER